MNNSGRSSPAPGAAAFLSSSLPTTFSSALSWTLRRLTSDYQTEVNDDGHQGRSDSYLDDRRVQTPISRRISPYAPPPLDPIRLTGAAASTSTLLTKPIAEEIRLLLPARLQLHDDWSLTYSLEEHGVSLTTLYSRQDMGAYVLVVRDSLGAIFGAYVNEPFRASGRYYGNGECFLWKSSLITLTEHHQISGQSPSVQSTDAIRFKAFPYSGMNDYMIFCDHTFLSLGGGDGHYGLWLDDEFLRGVSSTCPTFGNESLSEEGTTFDVLGVELWRVGPASL